MKRETFPDGTCPGIQGWFFNLRRAVVQGSARARGARLRLRFRMDQSQSDVWRLQAHHILFRKLRHEGGRAAESPRNWRCSSRSATSCPPMSSASRLRPPVSDGSGQDRTLLQQRQRSADGGGLRRKDSMLLLPTARRSNSSFSISPARWRSTPQPFIKNLKLLGINARIRIVDSAQYKQRIDDFDFDVVTDPLAHRRHSPGDEMRWPVSARQAGEDAGLAKLAGIADPVVDALIDKALKAKTRAELVTICRALDRVLRRRSLLGSALVFAQSCASRLGICLRPPRCARRSYDPGIGSTWWWDEAKSARKSICRGAEAWALYIARRHAADDPDALRDPGDFLRHRAIRAGRAGRAHHRAAAGPGHRRDRRFSGGGGEIGHGGAQTGASSSAETTSKYRGAQGLDPKFIAELEKQFGFDKPPLERFLTDDQKLRDVRLRPLLFSRRAACIKLISEKLPVSISLGLWMTLISYAISIPLGIAKAVRDGDALRRLDLDCHHRRLCDPELPLCDPADRALRRRLVLADLSAARPDLGGFRSTCRRSARSATISGT